MTLFSSSLVISLWGQGWRGFKSSKAVYDSMEFSDLNSRVEGDMAVVTGVLHRKGATKRGSP
jgi:hypothetical protein